MTKFAHLLSLLVPLAVLGAGEDAIARDRQPLPATMPVGDLADAPLGFVEMCARDKMLCLLGATTMPSPMPAKIEFPGVMQAATGAMEMSGVAKVSAQARHNDAAALSPFVPPAGRVTDEAQLRLLAKQVNSRVNRFTIQIPDVGENWARPVGDRERFGDCEDLAIEKRAELTEAGFPPERMFYAVSFVRGYGLHTVLVVRLDDGDHILDSMVTRMKRWSATRQIWLRRQVEGSPLRWVRLEGGDARAGLLAQGAAEPTLSPS